MPTNIIATYRFSPNDPSARVTLDDVGRHTFRAYLLEVFTDGGVSVSFTRTTRSGRDFKRPETFFASLHWVDNQPALKHLGPVIREILPTLEYFK